MKKLLFTFSMIAFLLLSACAQSTPAPTATLPQPQPTKPAGDADCTVVSLLPDPFPLPPVTDADWIKGDKNAKITVIEYSDFQCPGCAAITPELMELVKQNPDVRVVFRHFPLSFHDKALLGAQAVEAAGLQGKFWELHDVIFASQSEWNVMTVAEYQDWLVNAAKGIGLDGARFASDLTSDTIVQKVQQESQIATSLGLGGTPSLFFDGLPYQSQYVPMLAELTSVVNRLKAVYELKPRLYTSCPPPVIDTAKKYIATLKTEKGDVVIELFADKAPVTVNSFVFLAREGWFNDITFHRMLPDFVAQTGDPTGTGMGGPGYQFINETNDLKYDKPGVVGMANAGVDTNGSQFFITLVAEERLNGGYTIFGQVIEGMDVLKGLAPRDPQTDPNAPPGDKLLAVVITEQ